MAMVTGCGRVAGIPRELLARRDGRGLVLPGVDRGEVVVAMAHAVVAGMRSEHPELARPPKRCLGARAGCFLALGSGLGLVGTVSARR